MYYLIILLFLKRERERRRENWHYVILYAFLSLRNHPLYISYMFNIVRDICDVVWVVQLNDAL